MASIDYEKKINNKSYKFFDIIYRLIVMNILMIVLSCTVVLMYPSIVASIATMKEGPISMNIFKQYFKNFLKYFKQSFMVGIFVVILILVGAYGVYFYSKSQIQGNDDFLKLFLNAGFLVCLFGLIIIIFLSGHLPQLIITFKSFTIGEYFRTAFFVTFRYFLTTLILLVLNLVIIGSFVCCIIRFQILAVWMLIGISLPMFLGLKITAPMYYKFSKIDFEKIMHAVEEEENE